MYACISYNYATHASLAILHKDYKKKKKLLYKVCEEHAVELATIIANYRSKHQPVRSPWGST